MTRYADMKHPPEAIRLHLDWWGKCRTCSFWTGPRESRLELPHKLPLENFGKCTNPKSDLFKGSTWTEGHCKEWDTYDIEAAVALLDNEQEHAR